MALTVPVAEIVKNTKNPLLGKHKSWGRVLLGEIATVLNGYAFKSAKFTRDKGFPLIRIRDVGKGSTDTNYDGEYDKKYIVAKGDLLIGMDGDFHSGRWHGPKGLLNQRVCKVILETEDFSISFLEYLLPGYLKAINNVTSSVTVKHLSSQSIKEIPLPFPPVNEQKRIVAEIEKQFSRLDEAVDNLKRVKSNLKRYKASILKAAVEGKLTEDWRKANPDVEPAGKLLERILAGRRKTWEEAELSKMKAKGKVPKDDKWKKKYKKPLAPETEGLNTLPDNWTWCSFGQLIQQIKAGKSFKCNERPPNGKEVGVVKVSAVTWGEFNELESKTVTDKSKVNQDYFIHQGDLLFSRANTIELVGACVIANLFKRKLMLSDKILRLDLTFDLKKWCLICLRTRFGRNEIESLATGNQESMRNISQANIMKIRLPLPPLEEQYSVINELEQILTQCQMVDKMCDVNLKRADSLRQSILKKAFSGLLV